ncbi:MAG: hypothetical protein ABIJ96_17560 [Elusimicrobiota bacterium]
MTGLGVFFLYLAFPSYLHNFDGVACAIAVELGDLRHLVHGNHMLFGLAGCVFFKTLSLIGMKSALASLKLLDSLLAAAGAGIMHRLLRRLGFSNRIAALCGVGLAVSYGYWLWGLEVQVYMLGAVLLLLTLEEAVRDEPRPVRLALWHAAAMLCHGANVLFAPAAIYALWRSRVKSKRRGALLRYAAAASGTVLLAYLLVALFIIRPHSFADLRLWLLGSAALGPDRTVLWHGQGLSASLRDWLRMSAELVSPIYWLSLPLWGAALWSLSRLREHGRFRPLIITAWLWLPAYALLFTQWEPYTLVYRVSDLVPLWLLAAVAAHHLIEWKGWKAGLLAAAYIPALALTNLQTGIRPKSEPQSNAALSETLWIQNATPENAWIAAYGIEEVYFPYFAHRHPLNLRYFQGREQALTERLWEMLEAGRPVYVTAKRLQETPVFPPGLGLREVARRGDLVLYEITSIAQ